MKVPIKNPGNSPMYVGSTMIPPGETKHFDLQDLPAHLRPKPVEPEVEVDGGSGGDDTAVKTAALDDILAKPVKDIQAILPALSDEELEALSVLEQKAEKPRTTLLNAIGELQLDRAIEAEEKAKKAAAVIAGGNADDDKGKE